MYRTHKHSRGKKCMQGQDLNLGDAGNRKERPLLRRSRRSTKQCAILSMVARLTYHLATFVWWPCNSINKIRCRKRQGKNFPGILRVWNYKTLPFATSTGSPFCRIAASMTRCTPSYTCHRKVGNGNKESITRYTLLIRCSFLRQNNTYWPRYTWRAEDVRQHFMAIRIW